MKDVIHSPSPLGAPEFQLYPAVHDRAVRTMFALGYWGAECPSTLPSGSSQMALPVMAT